MPGRRFGDIDDVPEVGLRQGRQGRDWNQFLAPVGEGLVGADQWFHAGRPAVAAKSAGAPVQPGRPAADAANDDGVIETSLRCQREEFLPEFLVGESAPGSDEQAAREGGVSPAAGGTDRHLGEGHPRGQQGLQDAAFDQQCALRRQSVVVDRLPSPQRYAVVGFNRRVGYDGKKAGQYPASYLVQKRVAVPRRDPLHRRVLERRHSKRDQAGAEHLGDELRCRLAFEQHGAGVAFDVGRFTPLLEALRHGAHTIRQDRRRRKVFPALGPEGDEVLQLRSVDRLRRGERVQLYVRRFANELGPFAVNEPRALQVGGDSNLGTRKMRPPPHGGGDVARQRSGRRRIDLPIRSTVVSVRRHFAEVRDILDLRLVL